MSNYISKHSGLDIDEAIQSVLSVEKILNQGKFIQIDTSGKLDATDIVTGVSGVKGNSESSYRSGNVNLTPANIGAATSAQGSKADSAVQTIQIGGVSLTKSSGTVNLPAYPTSLPASNTTDTYSSTGTAPVSGKAVAAALGTLDVSSVGGAGKYISEISETDGKISATAATLNKSAVGLGNVDNKSSATIRGEITSSNVTTALGYTPLDSQTKGSSNGVAELDSSGKVPSSLLPSYVDDVLEYASRSSFPSTGESGKIYIATDTNLTYRWTGTTYVTIASDLALGETSSTAYRGDRGKTAYDHSQSAHARVDATKVETSSTNGNIKINNQESTVYVHPSTHAASMITGLSTVATTGSYSDLSNKPTIDNNNQRITGNGTSFGENDTINIVGSGATTVTASTSNKNIVINSTDTVLVAYGTCSTSAAIANKVVAVGDTNWLILTGSIIGVKFTTSNLADNVTLNVNNSGAKSIWYSDAVYTGTSTTYCGYANRVIYYMYDGLHWVWLHCGWNTDNNTLPSALCTTAASTAAKTATFSYWTATLKSYFLINFRYENSYAGKLTLNINSTGAKPVYINGSVSSASNYSLPAASYIAYYDGTNYYLRTDGKLTASIVGDATTVNGKTVLSNVPADAKFTDTTYVFDGTYNASTNKAATVSTVTNAISLLDGTISGTPGAGKTLTAFSETDGKVNATFGNISITKSQVSDLGTLGAAASRGVDTSVSSTSGNLPTSEAVYSFVNNTYASKTYVDTNVSSLQLDISGKESVSNKVTVVVPESSDLDYPTAKSVYNIVKRESGMVLEYTLTAGQTSFTLLHVSITASSLIDVYVDLWGINPENVVSTTGNVTLTFKPLEQDLNIRIVVKNPDVF